MSGVKEIEEELIWIDAEEDDKVWYRDQNGTEQSLKLMPNKMLLRKCKHDTSEYLIGKAKEANIEQSGLVDALLKSMEDGITLDTMFALNWCEIICIGRVRPYDKAERKKLGIGQHYGHFFNVGDFVVMKESSIHGRFWRGTWGKDYMLISELHEPFAMMLKKDWATDE